MKKLIFCTAFLHILLVVSILGAQSVNEFFSAESPGSDVTVDHRIWDDLLQTYIRPSGGINLFAYSAVTAADKSRLDRYIADLESVNPAELNRDEQLAYWINLYNAVTVDLILDSYPVNSIRSLGAFNSGPWNRNVVEVRGRRLSLNDIEHRIIRPVFNNNLIHYAVNCSSLGCPNLGTEAYTGSAIDRQLAEAATAFINHPRAVEIDGNQLRLSRIFDWYREDFGGTVSSVITHLRRFADPALAEQLAGFDGRTSYHYDWNLNASEE